VSVQRAPNRSWQKRPALFNGHWTDPTGAKIARATQAELREANRLWWRHRDIREGRVR
jgi:hypothetical protein